MLGYYLKALVVFTALVELLLQSLQLLGLSGREVGTASIELVDFSLQVFEVREKILGSYSLSGVGIHAMHVGDDLEGSLLG